MYNQKPKTIRRKEHEMFRKWFEIGKLVHYFFLDSNILLDTSFNIASVIYFSWPSYNQALSLHYFLSRGLYFPF